MRFILVVSRLLSCVLLPAGSLAQHPLKPSTIGLLGGLMSYGVSIHDLDHRAATYVDKILKGARPSEFPMEQPTNFELIINLKTAKADWPDDSPERLS